jgi:rare lipoprotein A
MPRSAVVCALLLSGVVGGCARRNTVEEASEPSHSETLAEPGERQPRAEVLVGNATWYGAALAGHRTANGERFDPRQMTAAHRFFAFGTWVEVACPDTGRRVRVRITDRGPFGHEERIIDLSRAAAEKLGIIHRGVARVELRVVEGP